MKISTEACKMTPAKGAYSVLYFCMYLMVSCGVPEQQNTLQMHLMSSFLELCTMHAQVQAIMTRFILTGAKDAVSVHESLQLCTGTKSDPPYYGITPCSRPDTTDAMASERL